MAADGGAPAAQCETNPESPQCQCESDFLQQNPHSCMAGDFDNAVKKMQGQLFLPEYNAFLDYMCPGHRAHHYKKGAHLNYKQIRGRNEPRSLLRSPIVKKAFIKSTQCFSHK